MPVHPETDIAVRAAARLGQSPTWDTGTHSLLWVDAAAQTVHRFGPGPQDHVLEVLHPVSAAKPRKGRGLVLHLSEGIALFSDDDEQRTWLVYWARDGFRGGTTAVDSRGRLWASTQCESASGGGWLARVAGDGAASAVLDDVTTGTGLAWSPDDTLLYFVDDRRIDVFDFDAPSGRLSGHRPLCHVSDGEPKGLCVDTEGCLWTTVGAELRRYTPDGTPDRSVPLPVRHPTGCCFGGIELTDLYVTSARQESEAGELDGSLLVLTGLGRGLLPAVFAG